MALTLQQIADAVGGRIEGAGEVTIERVSSLSEAGPGALTFLSNPRYADRLPKTRAAAVIVGDDWQGACPAALIRVADPDRAFAEAAALLAPKPPEPAPGVHPTAVVAEDAILGADVSIGPHCVLESGVQVGDRSVIGPGCCLGHATVVGRDCRLYPLVSTREYVTIGDRVIIHNGAVIGSDGFGYTHAEGAWHKIPQVGTVSIGNDVEIGANVTIDRARFGKTLIEDGVKIDNLVQVAHNVRVGAHTAMASQVGISGSTCIGRGVRLGGQAGLAGHLNIGDGAVVGAQAGVTKDVEPGSFVSGYPAMPHAQSAKLHAHLVRMPRLKEKIRALEQRIEQLESQTESKRESS